MDGMETPRRCASGKVGSVLRTNCKSLDVNGSLDGELIEQDIGKRGDKAYQAELVPKAGLEPARLAPHAPQTCVSAIPPLRQPAGTLRYLRRTYRTLACCLPAGLRAQPAIIDRQR